MPRIVTIGLGVTLPLVSQVLALGAARLLQFKLEAGFNLSYLYTQHGVQLAPIIGHNAGDGVAYGLMFLWVGLAP